MLTVCVTVVLIGTFPKSSEGGLAVARLMPVPVTLNGVAMQLPPAIGHSKTLVVPLEAPIAVGRNVSLTLQVPGPAKPPPAPQVSKSKENGTLMPEPLASCVRYPASTWIVTSCVTLVLI